MKSPAYLLYYKDFEADTSSWEADAVGYMIRLMNHQAANGFIPSDIEEIAQIAKVKYSQYDTFLSRWKTRISPKWISLSEGKLYNKKLHKVIHDNQLKARKKSILSIFGNIIKYDAQAKKHASSLKKSFDYQLFMEVDDDDLRKETIKKYVSTHLATAIAKRSHIVDVDAKADIKVKENKKGGPGETEPREEPSPLQLIPAPPSLDEAISMIRAHQEDDEKQMFTTKAETQATMLVQKINFYVQKGREQASNDAPITATEVYQFYRKMLQSSHFQVKNNKSLYTLVTYFTEITSYKPKAPAGDAPELDLSKIIGHAESQN